MAAARLNVLLASLVTLVVVAFLPRGVTADHAWGKYKWSIDGPPLTLQVGDNVDSTWDWHLVDAAADWDHGAGAWNVSDVLALAVVNGLSDATCSPTLGRIEVCNDEYGLTGWLGVAQIWISRGSTIVQATTQVNDTYFNSAPYNTWAWRQFVMCQEIGHDFGLDHQDETQTNGNLGSCMDYTRDPTALGPNGQDNTKPNQHDYEQLAAMYGASSGGSKKGGGGGGGGGGGRRGGAPPVIQLPGFPEVAQERAPIDSPGSWGQLVRSNGRVAVFDLDLGFGNHIITFVIWA